MSYFDDPLHSTGALTTALSTHASAVQGVGTIIQGKFYGGFKKGNYFTKLPQMRTNFSRGRGGGGDYSRRPIIQGNTVSYKVCFITSLR